MNLKDYTFELIYPENADELRKKKDEFFKSIGLEYDEKRKEWIGEGVNNAIDNLVPILFWYEACDTATRLANKILELKEKQEEFNNKIQKELDRIKIIANQNANSDD